MSSSLPRAQCHAWFCLCGYVVSAVVTFLIPSSPSGLSELLYEIQAGPSISGSPPRRILGGQSRGLDRHAQLVRSNDETGSSADDLKFLEARVSTTYPPLLEGIKS